MRSFISHRLVLYGVLIPCDSSAGSESAIKDLKMFDLTFAAGKPRQLRMAEVFMNHSFIDPNCGCGFSEALQFKTPAQRKLLLVV